MEDRKCSCKDTYFHQLRIFKYNIIRRALLGRGKKEYSKEELIYIAHQLENKNIKQLLDIHKEYIYELKEDLAYV